MALETALEIAPGCFVRLAGPDAQSLEVTTADDRTRLRHALREHLVVRTADGAREVVLGERVRARFGDAPQTSPRAGKNVEPLTAFECRFLADNGVPLASPATRTTWQPRTDLHTHFAGALPGAVLVALAADAGLVLARAQLSEAGVHAEGETRVDALTDAQRAALARHLDLPLDAQSTFHAMELRYARRKPFTKSPALLRAQVHAIASGFAASGVRYAELSLSTCLEEGVLAVLHEELDAVEQATGVRLRFLVALARHDDLEWDLDVLRHLEACLHSRAIAGVDFMGQETCSTHRFVPLLEVVGELSKKRPGLACRVHAGENPAFPENVRVAFETLARFDTLEARIGHGVYGVDDKLMQRMAELGERVVVEVNLTSNFALNNIQSVLHLPLARYLDAGVSVVLGTDGAGLYGTCARDEVQAALACGLTDAHIQQLASVEERLLALRDAREARLPALADARVPPKPAPLHWRDDIAAHNARVREERRSAQAARVQELGAELREEAPARDGREVLWITGAWQNAIRAWTPEHHARARAVLAELLDALRVECGERALVLTGGTRHGVEALVHELAHERGMRVVGAIVGETEPTDLDARVACFWRCADSLYAKADPVVRFVRDAHGFALFVGGGLIVADEVQATENMAVRHAVLQGFPGAASTAAAASKRTRVAMSATEVLDALRDTRPVGRLRHPGANAAVDIVALRINPLSGRREVLVIRRHDHSGAAAGKLALPGGFVAAAQSAEEAGAAVLLRETGLVVEPAALRRVGVVEGGGRDPRDTDERWVRSDVLVADIPSAARIVAGAGAASVLFAPVDKLPDLAFDHAAVVRRFATARGPVPPAS